MHLADGVELKHLGTINAMRNGVSDLFVWCATSQLWNGVEFPGPAYCCCFGYGTYGPNNFSDLYGVAVQRCGSCRANCSNFRGDTRREDNTVPGAQGFGHCFGSFRCCCLLVER